MDFQTVYLKEYVFIWPSFQILPSDAQAKYCGMLMKLINIKISPFLK